MLYSESDHENNDHRDQKMRYINIHGNALPMRLMRLAWGYKARYTLVISTRLIE